MQIFMLANVVVDYSFSFGFKMYYDVNMLAKNPPFEWTPLKFVYTTPHIHTIRVATLCQPIIYTLSPSGTQLYASTHQATNAPKPNTWFMRAKLEHYSIGICACWLRCRRVHTHTHTPAGLTNTNIYTCGPITQLYCNSNAFVSRMFTHLYVCAHAYLAGPCVCASRALSSGKLSPCSIIMPYMCGCRRRRRRRRCVVENTSAPAGQNTLEPRAARTARVICIHRSQFIHSPRGIHPPVPHPRRPRPTLPLSLSSAVPLL